MLTMYFEISIHTLYIQGRQNVRGKLKKKVYKHRKNNRNEKWFAELVSLGHRINFNTGKENNSKNSR